VEVNLGKRRADALTWEDDDGLGAFVEPRSQNKTSAVKLDETPDDRQAEPGTFLAVLVR
jgi:hypothetical protein